MIMETDCSRTPFRAPCSIGGKAHGQEHWQPYVNSATSLQSDVRMDMQEAFDAAVRENIDEFGMEVSRGNYDP